MSFKKIEDLYNNFKWKSESKFIPLAKKYGFTAGEARQFLKGNVEHDSIPKKPQFMHIYSKEGNEYQMDIFINAKDEDKAKSRTNFLCFININTRKAYAYPIHGKTCEVVLGALHKFVNDEPNVKTIVSDEDPAFLKVAGDEPVLTFMKEHNINYRTTEDNNHNILGIINRFMRTARDYFGENREISPSEMSEFVRTYNDSPHRSIQKAPNEMTE